MSGLACWEPAVVLAVAWRREGAYRTMGMRALGFSCKRKLHSPQKENNILIPQAWLLILSGSLPRFVFPKYQGWVHFLINWAITLTTGNADASSQLQHLWTKGKASWCIIYNLKTVMKGCSVWGEKDKEQSSNMNSGVELWGRKAGKWRGNDGLGSFTTLTLSPSPWYSSGSSCVPRVVTSLIWEDGKGVKQLTTGGTPRACFF